MAELNLLPVRMDVRVKRKSPNSLRLTFLDAAGAVVDITLDQVRVRTLAQQGSAVAMVAEKIIGPGGATAHSAPTLGQTVFTWTAAELDDADVDASLSIPWWWEAWRYVGGATGVPIAYFEGVLTLEP